MSMHRPRPQLAIGAAIFCSLVLLWLAVPYVSQHDWRARLSDKKKADTERDALLAETGRLRGVVEEVEAKLASLKAVEAEVGKVEASATSASTAKGFGYVFYATTNTYACSVLVNIHRLRNLFNSSIPIHVLASSDVGHSYISAFHATGALVHIEQVPPLAGNVAAYYQDCMLKLLAFKMQLLEPSLKRVLAFDSDQLIMRNLDDLFTGLPEVDLAAPRAYWLAKDFLASTFLMITLSDRLWKTVRAALDSVAFNKFDMDLINDLLGDEVMMLSGEYVTLNSHWEDWNLPKWYHAVRELNMTTIKVWNAMARAGNTVAKRDEMAGEMGVDVAVGGTSGQETTPSSAASTSSAAATFTAAMDPALPSSPLALPATASVDPPASARFPLHHPFTKELYRLQDAAAVIHFTAQGKPWGKPASMVRAARPDAHPLLADQFELWRNTAEQVCPGGTPQS